MEFEIECKGATLNAYTTRDYTVFLLNLHKNDLEWGIELFSDIFLGSVYPKDLFERERKTIYTELLECQKEEYQTNMEHSHNCSYFGHAIGRPILGKQLILGMKNNIFTLKREQVIKYHQQNYTAKNFNLVAVGNLEHDDLVSFCEKYFGNVPEHAPDYVPDSTQNDSKMMKILPLGNEGFSYLEDDKRIQILPNHNFGLYPSYDANDVYKDQFHENVLIGLDNQEVTNQSFINVDTQPVFQPNLMVIEGHNQSTTKVGIYYDAPNWFDPEMYVFLLLQRMIGKPGVYMIY
jgi:hypothetical protein